MHLFLTFLGRFWRSPDTAISAPSLSGSSPGLPGEFHRLLCLERLRLHSDMFNSFFGRFPTSSMLHGTANTSTSHPRSPGSTFVLPGKSSRPFAFECSLTCPDVVRGFISHFLSSPLHPGASNVSPWALVHSTSQLVATLLSASSLTLGDSVCHCVGLSGGFGSSGKSLDLFASHPQH